MNSLMRNNNNIINQFLQFRNQLGNKNPEQIVRDLLASGKMTQEQFHQLQSQAKQLEPMLRGFMK